MDSTDHGSRRQAGTMEKYYAFQSKIYDSTRWSFLFGRDRILKKMPLAKESKIQILEIGCGTGYNLLRLARQFPYAQLTGLDASSDMIRISKEKLAPFGDRVHLLHEPYGMHKDDFSGKMDVILFSYSLTMINPQWSDLLRQAYQDLKPGGIIAVVDFHDSPFGWFKRHMGNNHVRMDSHLVPVLEQQYTAVINQVCRAYFGIWFYLLYLGKK